MTRTELRSRDVGRAIVSSRLEGVEPTPLFLEAAESYAAGSTSLQDLLEAGDRRWPLARG
jgi:hypothetical protein